MLQIYEIFVYLHCIVEKLMQINERINIKFSDMHHKNDKHSICIK